MTRAEAWLRLALAATGLALVAVALLRQDRPEFLALVEVLGIAALFCLWLGATALRHLVRGDR